MREIVQKASKLSGKKLKKKDLMEIQAEIIKFERNIEDLHFPFVTLKIEDKERRVELPIQILQRFLSGNWENYIGKEILLEKRIARKYIRYFIDLRKFNFNDYKEWEIKQLQEVKQ